MSGRGVVRLRGEEADDAAAGGRSFFPGPDTLVPELDPRRPLLSYVWVVSSGQSPGPRVTRASRTPAFARSEGSTMSATATTGTERTPAFVGVDVAKREFQECLLGPAAAAAAGGDAAAA